MHSLRRVVSDLQFTLRKVPQRRFIVYSSVKFVSAFNSDQASPLYLRWKLKDHRLHSRVTDLKVSDAIKASATPKNESERATYKKYLPHEEDYLNLLREELKYSKKEAEEIIGNAKCLTERNFGDFKELLRLLKKYKVAPHILKSNSFVFWLPSGDVDRSVTQLMSQLDVSASVALPLLQSWPEVQNYINKVLVHDIKFLRVSRIVFLAEKFSVAPEVISCWLSLYPFMLRIKSLKLKILTTKTLCVLPPEVIMADPQFYNHGVPFVVERLKLVQNMSPEYRKGWMLRTGLPQLNKIVEDERCSGDTNWRETLHELLDADVSQVQLMYRNQRGLRSVRYCKFKKIAEILDEFEYPRNFVCTAPKIMLYSPERLRDRLAYIKNLGVTSEELVPLKSILFLGKQKMVESLERYRTIHRKENWNERNMD